MWKRNDRANWVKCRFRGPTQLFWLSRSGMGPGMGNLNWGPCLQKHYLKKVRLFWYWENYSREQKSLSYSSKDCDVWKRDKKHFLHSYMLSSSLLLELTNMPPELYNVNPLTKLINASKLVLWQLTKPYCVEKNNPFFFRVAWNPINIMTWASLKNLLHSTF